MSLATQVVNFRRDCTGFEFRITKDGSQQSQLMLLYCRKQDRYTNRCWRTQVKSLEAPHSWIHSLYQGFRTCLKLLGIRSLNQKLTNSWPEIKHKLAEKHSILHVQISQAWGPNESGEEETDRCGRQAIIKSKCNRCWQGSDPGSEMTSRSPPDVSERGEISQQEGTKANWRLIRRKDENLFCTTAIITHDHYFTGSVEHHLQPHQSKRSRVTSQWLRLPHRLV